MTRRYAPVLALLLSACAVGPNFHTPAAPTQTGYTETPITQAGGQTITPGAPVPAAWWHAFGSPALDALVAEALAHNSDLAAQRAALKAARETWLASKAVLLPTLDAGANTSRNRSSQYLAPVPNNNIYDYSLQTAQVSVGYTLDLFGGGRRQIEQTHAQYDAQGFEAEAARQTLIANVIAGAVNLASLKAQVAAQQRIVALGQQSLEIARRQQQQGQTAGLDLLAQQTALASAEAALPPLQKQLAQARDALAYLVGRAPADGLPAEPDLATIALPVDLPLTLPSELVRQRPDIRAAEANLHAASAAVGIAVAARLPTVTLGASIGGQSANWAQIFSTANQMWTVGAGITQPIFEGGKLLHQQKAAEAQLDQARALYRSAVLTAFQNVADTLQALALDADALTAAQAAREAARQTYAIAQRQHADGEIATYALLNAEQSWRTAEQAAITAEAQRLADTAALYQALGGDWSEKKG